MEHESDGDTNRNWYTWYNPQRIGKETGRLGNKRISGDHLNYSIKIIQITALRWRLEVTCCHSDPAEKSSAYDGVKIFLKCNNNNRTVQREFSLVFDIYKREKKNCLFIHLFFFYVFFFTTIKTILKRRF